MPHPRWLLMGAAILLVAFALLAATVGRRDPAGATADGSSSSAPSLASSATPIRTTPAPSISATPTPTRPPTPAPRASGPPRLAWAEFLLHVNDDRSTVEGLNRALATAADAQDLPAVRKASVAILDFVDAERAWLREHPPADCYAAAHASAGAMLDAYAAAAERFIDWTATGGGLAGLAALGVAVEAADAARVALTSFGSALEDTTCPV